LAFTTLPSWVAAEDIPAADLQAMCDAIAELRLLAASGDTQNTSGTTTSTTYTATLTGGTACGIAFTAPASGKVEIFNNCALVNSGASHALCTIRVRTGATIGSGADVVAAADANAIYHVGTNELRFGNSYLLTGLTAGSSYNVQQLFRVTGGTGTFLNKSLIVQGVA
jgi:hypothetical protein